MAFNETKELDLEDIQRKFSIPQRDIDNLPFDKSELNTIYQNFQLYNPKLEEIKSEILTVLNEQLEGKVHSIRARIKDKDHVIEKIIRNVYKRPDKWPNKYEIINADNYNKIITDLIGVRIIILDKRDWREIHESLLRIFHNLPDKYIRQPKDIITNYDKYAIKYKKESDAKKHALDDSYHAEQPIVYITSKDDRELYQDENLKVDNSKTHYRSIHYIIRYRFVYFEIQVRTLFEEGWLEFDHRIKYPYDQKNRKKDEYASVLSSLAVAADRLISFYDEMDFVQESCDNIDEHDTVQETTGDVYKSEEKSLNEEMKRLF